jgi:hypothetical protein
VSTSEYSVPRIAIASVENPVSNLIIVNFRASESVESFHSALSRVEVDQLKPAARVEVDYQMAMSNSDV